MHLPFENRSNCPATAENRNEKVFPERDGGASRKNWIQHRRGRNRRRPAGTDTLILLLGKRCEKGKRKDLLPQRKLSCLGRVSWGIRRGGGREKRVTGWKKRMITPAEGKRALRQGLNGKRASIDAGRRPQCPGGLGGAGLFSVSKESSSEKFPHQGGKTASASKTVPSRKKKHSPGEGNVFSSFGESRSVNRGGKSLPRGPTEDECWTQKTQIINLDQKKKKISKGAGLNKRRKAHRRGKKEQAVISGPPYLNHAKTDATMEKASRKCVFCLNLP